ncbi:hypothetical protein FGB62_110g00 [Gracilaria domingensis]|nr:hypothetical protein FGB62_110g00 [Gracilaria domingensis]
MEPEEPEVEIVPIRTSAEIQAGLRSGSLDETCVSLEVTRLLSLEHALLSARAWLRLAANADIQWIAVGLIII